MRFSVRVIGRLECGITHGGVRWKTCSRAKSGAMAGTNWMAEAPVPTEATRWPARSTEWSQRAEWNAGPANLSSPGKSGIFGSTSGPVALTSTFARSGPCEVSSSHSSPFQRAACTSHRRRSRDRCCSARFRPRPRRARARRSPRRRPARGGWPGRSRRSRCPRRPRRGPCRAAYPQTPGRSVRFGAGRVGPMIGKALRAVAVDYSLLRRRRDLRLLTVGYAVSLAGSEFTLVALTVQLYALTHSTVAVGLLGLAEFIPIVALALVGGALADAFDRRKLIWGAEAASLLVSLALVGNALLPHPSTVVLYLAAALFA